MPELPEARVFNPDAAVVGESVAGSLSEGKIARLKSSPITRILIEVFADSPGTYLVGGAVRDLLLGVEHFDVDVLVESDAAAAAEHLASSVGGTVRRHDRFLTASFTSDDDSVRVDFARARTETYSAPGALPDVTPAGVHADLARRDFTINAIAVALWTGKLGALVEFPGARGDLSGGLLRVTHEASFLDDPTRLLRLLRYGVRFGFSAEPKTEKLARDAVSAGAPATVSGARIRDELLDLLSERAAVVGIEALCALGLDRAIHPNLHADEYVAARALGEAPVGARQELLLLAACSREMDDGELDGFLDWLKLDRADRKRVAEAVTIGRDLLGRVAETSSAAEIDRMLGGLTVETLSLALATPNGDKTAAASVRNWIQSAGSERLKISGSDLMAAGISEGPAIGRALAQTMDAVANGELKGRDEQLRFAIEKARVIASLDSVRG